MQILFSTPYGAQDYATKDGTGEYPSAPERCPHKGCGMPRQMVKNGFYVRHVITLTYDGKIRIRRYKCKTCGCTVSMLPSFCIPQYTYSFDFIIALMTAVIVAADSVMAGVKAFQKANDIEVTRRQAILYRNRLRQNKGLIRYGINQISPGSVGIDDPPGDTEWTRDFLSGKRPKLTPETNANFHKATGKSFMSTQNRIA